MASPSISVTALLMLMAAFISLSLTAAADSGPTPGTAFLDMYFADEGAASSSAFSQVEVNMHVGRTVAIIFSVGGSVWLLVCLFLAYVFICICPECHTK
ncbi:none [Leptomonas seymouri]|uniref:None n=1 Tax=Leptomonas seymouri TaxID=5684 RepID=A0A0N1PBK3_LEPSE|nr:none [Leptomonas seymouri]|eukprot:KPI83698.1 none [Leptomonas seymouri]